MKQKNGKGLIKLLIGISIVSIIGTILVVYIRNMIKEEEVKGIQADLLILQAKIEIVKGNNSMNKDENPLKGNLLNQLPEDIDLKDFLEENIITEEEYEKYYLLDSKCLEELGLKDFVKKYDGFFIVNYDSFEVIYTNGYENINGLWCYKLSDLNKLPENKKNELNDNNNDNLNNENDEDTQNTENTTNSENNNESN